jgi:hypothetical protein
MPWPLSYTPLWLLLLSLVVFDSVRSQRRSMPVGGDKAADRFAFALAKSRMGYCRYAVGAQ